MGFLGRDVPLFGMSIQDDWDENDMKVISI